MDEFVTFPTFTQTRTHRPPRPFGDVGALPDPVRVTFHHGQTYRVTERRLCAYHDGYFGDTTEMTVFLEHPDLPGVEFGFLQSHFSPYTKRVQRSRQQKPGIPSGAVYVGRPSQWGNPARLETWYNHQFVNSRFLAVSMFYDRCKQMATDDPEQFVAWLKPLIGRNLCCWCALDEPCHADILLAIARHLQPIIDKPEFRTLIPESVKTWPEISCIIVF